MGVAINTSDMKMDFDKEEGVKTNTSSRTKQRSAGEYDASKGAWYRNWEGYLVILVGSFLRFYRIDTSQFEGDQVQIFRLAHDAVHLGLLPVTNGTASLGFANPPGLLYFYMLPAALSDNPILAMLLNSFFAVIAVFLTYLFVTRYYGRFAGAVAGLLYAAAPVPLIYSRFIWQPNMMQPFVVLFFLALFRGVVDRRTGWLPLALLWLAILLQTHMTVLLLIVPLFMALLFAPETLRWRDLGYSCLALLIVFFPYVLWELVTNFGDLAIIRSILLTQTCQHTNACIDNASWNIYLTFLGSHDPHQVSYTSSSLIQRFSIPLSWLAAVLLYCVIAGLVTALALSLYWWRKSLRIARGVQVVGDGQAPEMSTPEAARWRRWLGLMPPPAAAGLLLLCAWQLLPPLVTVRHTLPIYTHYLLVIIPGPFILVAIFLEKLREWFSRSEGRDKSGPYARGLLYSFTVLMLLLQTVGGTALVLDDVRGRFNSTGLDIYFSDFHSIQHAFFELDRLAQQRHVSRVYVAADFSTRQAMYFFSGQLHTPVTVFDSDRCLVLPKPADGPALLLTPPYADLTYTLLNHYAFARSVEQPPMLGGNPFGIFELSTPMKKVPPQVVFGQDMQLESIQTQRFSFDGVSRVISRWNWLRSLAPAYETTHHYRVRVQLGGRGDQAIATTCTFNAMRTGDRLLVAFDLPKGSVAPHTAALSVQYSISTQDMLVYGPLHLITHRRLDSRYVTLNTANGKYSIVVRAS
jgi:Dolichyl-phosphate-mannose-protein mannosyltransferase